MAQTKQEKPLAKAAADALVGALKEGLADLIEDEDSVAAIVKKWDTHNLAGKTRTQILGVLFADVKSVVGDKETQDSIWEGWQEVGLDEDNEKAEPPAKPATQPAQPTQPPAQKPAAGNSERIRGTDTGEILLRRQLRAMYQAILGREPDAGGFAFWTGQGSAGLGQMVDQLMTSPEAVGTDWATMLAYRAAVNAGPTFAQYSAAVVSLRTGAQTPTGLLTSLNPTLTTANVYKNLLGRNPVGAEGSQTPERAYVTIIASAEFQNTGTFRTATDHTNGLYIRLLYFLVLNRDADQGGYNFWVGQANALASGLFYNASPAARLTIIGSGIANPGFVGSPAFQQRFQ